MGFVLFIFVLGSAWAWASQSQDLVGAQESQAAQSSAAVEEKEIVSKDDFLHGFRGTMWGADKELLEESLQLVDCREISAIVENCLVGKQTDKYQDIPLVRTRYKFANGVFYAVSLKFKPENEKKVLRIAQSKLGTPTSFVEGVPQWEKDGVKAWASNTHFSLQSKTALKKGLKTDKGWF